LTAITSFLNKFLNPRFGNLLESGIWPPSNPGLTFPPDLAF